MMSAIDVVTHGFIPISAATGKEVKLAMQRLVKFLEGGKIQNDVICAIIKLARAGKPLEGDWSKRKPESALWDELSKALGIS